MTELGITWLGYLSSSVLPQVSSETGLLPTPTRLRRTQKSLRLKRPTQTTTARPSNPSGDGRSRIAGPDLLYSSSPRRGLVAVALAVESSCPSRDDDSCPSFSLPGSRSSQFVSRKVNKINKYRLVISKCPTGDEGSMELILKILMPLLPNAPQRLQHYASSELDHLIPHVAS
uniref:Uncharacterized protein n=1 Tax=Coccidioides posadasii RMSCC 3488 TaxID=454284 RepID=A0A0J6I7J4_COCPO|nr:hypothetical protein CPAG_03761 [Coccidioides posadasii RMSCC 3488]